jgi:hypothetical protein
MSDTNKINAIKDFAWTIGVFTIAIGLLVAGCILGYQLIDPQRTIDSLKIIVAAEAIPVFFLIATYQRMSGETVGVILGTVMGFALGKAL